MTKKEKEFSELLEKMDKLLTNYFFENFLKAKTKQDKKAIMDASKTCSKLVLPQQIRVYAENYDSVESLLLDVFSKEILRGLIAVGKEKPQYIKDFLKLNE